MTSEAVDHPKHYNTGEIEVIDAINDWRLGFALGNAVKYIARAGKKDPAKTIEDLSKARWYLDHEIERLKEAKRGAAADRSPTGVVEVVEPVACPCNSNQWIAARVSMEDAPPRYRICCVACGNSGHASETKQGAIVSWNDEMLAERGEAR